MQVRISGFWNMERKGELLSQSDTFPFQIPVYSIEIYNKNNINQERVEKGIASNQEYAGSNQNFKPSHLYQASYTGVFFI